MPEQIQTKLIEEEMKESYIDYAMSVIMSRALPDVHDGLKPVHRRILFAMHQLGLASNKPTRKSARIVGDCLGKFHPHGDTSVYDALVRMAQDFSLRYPLIIGQGNFGNQGGWSAASMRYTEAKLSKIAEELLTDIEKNTVNFIPNFDNSLKEPIVLPAKIPNLLVNGTAGIAVGMASNIPPHNLCEVIDAITVAIDNPEITAEELMKYIKGPDFPTGGIIAGTLGIIQAYKTGRGKIILKAKTELEKNKIIINEIPYQVNKTILIESIANLVKDKKVHGIQDIRDESDRKGMRIVIELKGNANAEVILNQLYKHTQLQNTFGIIMIALDAGQPKIMNLKSIITSHIKHRFRIVTRRTKFDLNKAEDRAHILSGLKIALANIDDVVKTIKSSDSPEIAKKLLIKNYKLSNKQAQAILDMKLQRLTSLEQNKIQKEYESLLELIAELKELLASDQKILEVIKKELLELKEKYKDERRTLIEESHEVLEKEDLIQEEDIVITATYSGYIKQTKLAEYKEQKRGGKGVIATETKEADVVENLFITSNHNYLLFFTNLGKVHWLKAYQIPPAGRYSKGKAIVNLLNLEGKEKVTAILPVSKFDESFILFATEKGLIKKTALKEFSHPRKGGIISINLRPKDELIATKLTPGNLDIIIASRNGLAVRFNEIDVKSTGRKSIGVRGIKLNKGDKVVGMELAAKNTTLLTVTENGYGKRTNVNEYRLIRRGGKGVINIKTSERNGKVIGIKTVSDEDAVMFITEKGNIIRTKVKGISTISRNTQGVRLMKLKDKDKVKDIAKVVTNHD